MSKSRIVRTEGINFHHKYYPGAKGTINRNELFREKSFFRTSYNLLYLNEMYIKKLKFIVSEVYNYGN